MRISSLLAAVVLLATSAPVTASEEGRKIAIEKCSRCHAVEMMDESKLPIAPPFRTLHHKYPISSLEEAFAEGITVGHEAMPEFRFEPDQIGALLAYIESLGE